MTSLPITNFDYIERCLEHKESGLRYGLDSENRVLRVQNQAIPTFFPSSMDRAAIKSIDTRAR